MVWRYLTPRSELPASWGLMSPSFPGWRDDPDECGPAPSCCYRSHQAWPLPVRSVINVTYGADSQPSYSPQGHLGVDKRAWFPPHALVRTPSVRQNRMGGLRPRLSHAAYSARSRLRKPPWRVCPVRDISGSRAVRMVLAGSQLRTPLTIVFAWPCVLAVCSGGAVRQLWAARRFGDAGSNIPTRAAGRHRLWGSWTVSAGGSCEAVRLSSVPDNRR